MTMTCERMKRVGVGEAREIAAVERGTVREVGDIGKRSRTPRFDDALHAGFGEPGDHPEAEAQRRIIATLSFQRAVPLAHRHVDRPHVRRAGARPARVATVHRNPSAAN